MRQTPLTCSGHTRPVVDLAFSGITPYGYFLISACKGEQTVHLHRNDGFSRFGPGPAPGCENACNKDVTLLVLRRWQAHVAPGRHRGLDRHVSWSQRCCLGSHSEQGRHQSRHRSGRLHSVSARASQLLYVHSYVHKNTQDVGRVLRIWMEASISL